MNDDFLLIVEDEMFVALDLEDILQAAGYAVGPIIDNRADCAVLSAGPRLALVDVNLRDGPTGPAIASDLHERFGTKIVFVTANPEQIEQAPPSTVGVIAKPFNPETVRSVVEHAMADKEVPRFPGFVSKADMAPQARHA